MQALAKATAATTNSTIELILTPRPRAHTPPPQTSSLPLQSGGFAF
jgi:hypothetical protein